MLDFSSIGSCASVLSPEVQRVGFILGVVLELVIGSILGFVFGVVLELGDIVLVVVGE